MNLTRRAFAGLAGSLPLSGFAQPRILRALLVGVSEYPGLPESFQLQGPRNDITRLRALLAVRGFEAAHVKVLADGVRDAHALPTREAIMAGLDQLERDAKPDDFALLYFGGHGSQQPARPGTPEAQDEFDGMHELFLPRDVSRLTPSPRGIRVVENAIADHEFRRVVDRMAARGTFVWAVFDACHSATLVRGGPIDGVRYRQVPPQTLGYTEQELEAARRQAARSEGTREAAASTGVRTGLGKAEPPGKAVYFYASQTTERSVELPLPQEVRPAARRTHGAFSHALMQALEPGVYVTYRQLAQQILAKFASMNIQPDMTLVERQKPAFGGTALDAPVFLQMFDLPPPQWPVVRDTTGAWLIQAGAFDRLEPGAVVALLPSPTSRRTDVLGYARVSSVDLSTAVAEPFAYNGRPPPASVTPQAGWVARLERPGANYTLRLAIEMDGSAPIDSLVASALDQLRKGGVAGVNLRWEARSLDADVILRIANRRALVLPVTQARLLGNSLPAGVAQVSFEPDGGGRPESSVVLGRLMDALHRISRATNLMRMATLASGRPRSDATGLNAKLVIRRKSRTRVPDEIFWPESTPVLRDGDQVFIEVSNEGSSPLDVNLIYVDVRFGVLCWPPRGTAPTLAPRATMALPEPLTVHGDPRKNDGFGLERLIVVGMRQHPLREDNNLAFLAQRPLDTVQTRSGSRDDTDDMRAFRDAAFAGYTTRSDNQATPPGAGTTLLVYNLWVAPPA